MKNKYYNEAIIGNKNMIASFSSKGELLRLFYPNTDYKQFVDEMLTGIKVNDSALIYLHEDINNEYKQYFTENTNILNTEIKNTYFNLSVKQTDFVSAYKNLLIKKYRFTNDNSINLDINFLVYSKLFTNINNMAGTKIERNICMQYTHDYTYCIFSKMPISSYRLHNSKEEIKSGLSYDKDYIGIGEDCAISYSIGTLKPGESKEIEIFIYINENKTKYKIDEIIQDVEKIKEINTERELKDTQKYWEKYVKEHDGLKIISNKEKWEKKVLNYEKVRKIYIRTILLFPLLSNEKTGGISAAIEIDENQTKCGRYSYCWPRDAVFVTKALDILKMQNETEKFYKIFCKNTQSKNGMWEQRFYTDGKLAPCWGYQIDETASIVYGIYEHYKQTKELEFLKDTYKMCKKAIDALKKCPIGDVSKSGICPFSDINNDKAEIFEKYESYDLWEMNEGIHLYSLSSIYCAFMSFIKIEEKLNKNAKTKTLEKYAQKIKEYCMKNFIEEDSRILKRNNKDNICDISLLGSNIPFEMIELNSQEIKNTVEKINLTLRTYTGGYLRFENDSYLNGNYPWPIATLWMALYNIKIHNNQEALKQIDFVTNTTTELGYIGEQVNNETMQTEWAIGLGWSHAMYIIALFLIEND